RCTFDGRINLNHHLMPDPVGEAFSVLLDRVEFLETRVSHLQRRLRERQSTVTAADGAAPKAEPVEII
ncbi:MAG: serine O-acetyltransferase, partial [Methylocystis sp.]|nr:serine O-acetyltransferase [Methylocystis sp.]